MKILISILFLMISLNADEMQRIENIVNDIAKLRVDYEKCSAQLKQQGESSVSFKAVEYKSDESTKKYENLIQTEKEKNSKLLKEIASLKKQSDTSDSLKNEILKLETVVKSQESLIQDKDKIINDLESKIVTQEKVVLEKVTSTPAVVCKKVEDTNVFPKLTMKDNSVVSVVDIKKSIKETVVEVEPATYRLSINSSIYDTINGNKILEWEKDRSFTSNLKSENWIKITGYFTDKQWHPSDKEMWIMLKEVTKR